MKDITIVIENFKKAKKKVLEIGFGQADFLIYLKKKNTVMV